MKSCMISVTVTLRAPPPPPPNGTKDMPSYTAGPVKCEVHIILPVLLYQYMKTARLDILTERAYIGLR